MKAKDAHNQLASSGYIGNVLYREARKLYEAETVLTPDVLNAVGSMVLAQFKQSARKRKNEIST